VSHPDPRDAMAVAEALCAWATEQFGGEVEVVGAPQGIGAGFDSYIHLAQLAGSVLPEAWREPLVVRILPRPDRMPRARAEAEVQGWCADRGYAAPRVLAVVAPDELFGLPAQVMERAPGVTMLDAIKARPWRARARVDQLAALQLQLHALDPTGWPGSTTATAVVDARLSLTRRAVADLDDPDLRSALGRAEELIGPCSTGGEVVVCHGDLHPLNVMVDGAGASVIDWTDAGLGQREADVSRTALLFHVAAIAASNQLERRVLSVAGPRMARRHLATYRKSAALDDTRMRRWEALHALHGWAQIAMLHADAFAGESSTSGNEARAPLALARWLRARFEAALG